MANDTIVETEENAERIKYKATVTNRRDFVKVLGSVGGVAGIAGCIGSDPEGDEEAQLTDQDDGDDDDGDDDDGDDGDGDDVTDKREELEIAISFEPWNLDPALHTDAASNYVQSVIYDEVIGLHYEKNEPVPELATELAQPVDDEGKVYDITLKEGIQFHNGTEATAEDLKYTFDWIADPENNAAVLGYAPQIEEAETEILDDYTVRLTLSEPHGLWNYWMTRVINGLVPKDSRGNLADAKGPKGIGTDLTSEPIGTGPFELTEWEPGNYIQTEAFEDHFRDDIPRIDAIRFDFIDESTTRVSQLQSGNTDFIIDVPAKDFEQVASAEGITAESIQGSGSQIIYHNLIDTGDNPMANVHNRRAVHYGVDAEELLTRVYHDRGVVQKGPWFPDSEWVPDSLKNMDMYDPEKAKAELEKGPNPDGFEANFMAVNDSVSRQLAEVIQSQLSEIGIEITINTLDTGSLFSRLYEQVDWHMCLAGWGQSIPHVFWWLFAGFVPQRNHNHWHHAPVEEPWEPSGPAPPEEYHDEFGTDPGSGHEWFRARLQESFETTDKDLQKEIAFELQEYVVDQVIQTDLLYTDTIEAWQDYVNNFKMGTFSSEWRAIELGDKS